ncbi:hypothetical protein [Streptomyces lydicus]|uniref:hypothetical protein n=1 Tax=Streptomyces lydicus TaxID=47763 RepID=UPI0037A6E88E
MNPQAGATSRNSLVRPACMVAGLASTAVSFVICRMALLDTDAAIEFWVLAVVMIAVTVAVTAGGALYLSRRLPRLSLLAMATLALVVIATAVSGATVRAWAYSDPTGRYARSYGAAGNCLADTAYRSDQIRIHLYEAGSKRDRMQVAPQGSNSNIALDFQNASKGGDLQPGNAETAAFLKQYHC